MHACIYSVYLCWSGSVAHEVQHSRCSLPSWPSLLVLYEVQHSRCSLPSWPSLLVLYEVQHSRCSLPSWPSVLVMSPGHLRNRCVSISPCIPTCTCTIVHWGTTKEHAHVHCMRCAWDVHEMCVRVCTCYNTALLILGHTANTRHIFFHHLVFLLAGYWLLDIWEQ